MEEQRDGKPCLRGGVIDTQPQRPTGTGDDQMVDTGYFRHYQLDGGSLHAFTHHGGCYALRWPTQLHLRHVEQGAKIRVYDHDISPRLFKRE